MIISSSSGASLPPASPSESPSSEISPGPHSEGKDFRRTLVLALGALGVVYGDIGTSLLYGVKECFHGLHAIAITHTNILGVMSLIFWSLMMVVTIKYVTFILKADNEGEGGIYALAALFLGRGAKEVSERTVKRLVFLAIFGAALLYGDGLITPVISVLSAVEGLNVATTAAEPYVLPIACVILVALFMVQRHGTERLGRVFGLITILWFISLAALGLLQVFNRPEILAALDPRHAVTFFMANRLHGMVVLGAVVLVITGGEALYADLGHFGRGPIKVLLHDLETYKMVRTPGPAAFLSVSPTGVPVVLLNYLKHNEALPEKAILLSIVSVDTPYVPKKRRISLEELGQGFYRVVASYGFMQTPKGPEVLEVAREQGLEIDIHATSFYMGRETLINSGDTQMAAWRKSLVTFLSRNSWNVSTYFGIPPDRVVELGSQVKI